MLFLLLILLSILSATFGSFIVWNNIVNYFDSFAHSAVFSVVIGQVLHLNEFTTLIVFAVIFASSFAICILRKVRLDNNLLIIVSSFFIGAASIFNSYFENKPHNHEHCEEGMMNLFLGSNFQELNEIELNNYVILSLFLLILCILYYKSWLKIIVNSQLIPLQNKDYLKYFIFLIAIGLFSIVTTKINGILLAIGTSIIPVFIVKKFTYTPTQMILCAIIFNIFISLISLGICYKFNVNYNGLVVLLEFAIFVSLSFTKFKSQHRLS